MYLEGFVTFNPGLQRRIKQARARLFDGVMETDRRARDAARNYAALAAQVEQYKRPPQHLIVEMDEAHDLMLRLQDKSEVQRREARHMQMQMAFTG